MWAKVPWYKDNTPRWHSLILVNYSFFFVFRNPNHPLPHALPRGWELSHTSLSTLAQLCYSTLFSLTGLFWDCSTQEDVWTFWKNHHFFSESIHKQFVLCVCVCVCVHACACARMLDCVWLFATPWTPLSMEFSRQECWSGSPFPIPGDLPNAGMEPMSLACCTAGRFFTTVPPVCSTRYSQAISYPSTNHAQPCLASEIRLILGGMAGSLCPKIIFHLSSQNPYLAVSLIPKCYLLVLTQSYSSPCIARASNSSTFQ